MTSIRDTDRWRISRDRVLLYVRALNLPPYKGLDLAVESLKRTGPSSAAESMESLRALLKEHGLDRGVLDSEGKHLASVPPLNRSVMVPEELDRVPWRTSFVQFLRRWKNDLFEKGRAR
ncbi:MAG TPA: hypothetical protein P5201_01710 [Aminobacteriaceae bacterium]|nr:hypothetical protein [Aminobacteriaceae bacterium]